MPAHLLAISIGPVQDFIATARRTRDLWLGSACLSGISKAVATRLAEHGELIFPAGVKADHIANVVLAELLDKEPKSIAAELEVVARRTWRETFGEVARERAEELVDGKRWDAQIDDVIEFYAAWHAFEPANYGQARMRVMRLLTARKRSRCFREAQGAEEGVEKSSLDGARESVWRRDFREQLGKKPELARELRLKGSEQLDVVGVVKRLSSPRHYPSVVRIAADPWLRGIPEDRIKELATKCGQLQRGVLPDVKWPQFSHFPFEGDLIYRNRYKDVCRDALVTMEDLEPVGNVVKDLQRPDNFGVPNPYFAVLAADGDGIGNRLNECRTPDEHRRFSNDLATFAGDAKKIVEENHGCLVYSGGDDVLAFIPVDKAIHCARVLAERFARVANRVKLSVGIVIGHFMDPLEDHLNRVREAEKSAKAGDVEPESDKDRPRYKSETERNGLAVHFYPHSGEPLKIRAQWSTGIDKQLLDLAELHIKGRIPDKAAYQLRDLSFAYEGWSRKTKGEEDRLGEAIKADVARLLGRKRTSSGDEETPLSGYFSKLRTAHDVRRMAEYVILARRLATAIGQGRGERMK